jgi:hypothetical protein
LTEPLLLLQQHRSVRIRRRLSGLLLACGLLCSAGACTRPLTPEETAFYERAAKIKVGDTLDVVRRQLGEPTRTFDAEGPCVSKGGRKEWVYESFESADLRKPLRAGSFSYCTNENGVVVAIFRIFA